MFNAADFLGTGAVRDCRYCAWYLEFDREKFERLFDAAIDQGVPFAEVINTRHEGKLIPAISLNKHDDHHRCADLRDPMQRNRIMSYCKVHIHYLDVLCDRTK